MIPSVFPPVINRETGLRLRIASYCYDKIVSNVLAFSNIFHISLERFFRIFIYTERKILLRIFANFNWKILQSNVKII